MLEKKVYFWKFLKGETMLNFVICDDNSHTIDNLKSMLEKSFIKHDLDWNIVFTTTKADKLLDYVAEHKCDVIILDINLHSTLNGLDIAGKIREYNRESYLIFTILISIIIGILIKIFTCLTRKFRYTIFYLFVT